MIRLALSVVAAFALLFLVGGLLLDPGWTVEVSRRIEASPAEVFALVESPRRWSEWTAWNEERTPGLELDYEGPAAGVGAAQRWSDGRRSGRFEIASSVPGKSVVYRVAMEPEGKVMDGQIVLSPEGESTRVTWTLWGDAGNNLLERWQTMFFEPLVRRDLENGLAQLGALAESEKARGVRPPSPGAAT